MPKGDAPTATCVLIGSDSLLIQCGQILLERGHEISAVVSRDEPILAWASSVGVETLAPGKGLAARLRPIEHDFLFSITNLSIIPEEVLELPRKAAINFHDGPLPRYAGMYAPAWALLNGESEYGVSFHEMTAGADEGDLYAQRTFELADDETSLSLNTRCFEAAIVAFGEMIVGLESGTLAKSPQDLTQRSYFARYQRPDASAVLDWQRPADELARWVRALDFGHYENAFCAARVLHNGVLHLVRVASLEYSIAGAEPGLVISLADDHMLVGCGDGQGLRLTEWTCPRGVPLTASEVANRIGVTVGDRLDGLTEQIRARLDDVGEAAARAEAFWVRRLESLDGVEMPYRRSQSTADLPAALAGIDLERPSGFEGDASVWIAGLAGYLARVSGRTTFDVGYSGPELRERIDKLDGVFSAEVPIPIEIQLDCDPSALRESVAEGIARAVERGPVFADVIARYPRLSANGDLVAGRLSPVAVDVTEDLTLAGGSGSADWVLAVTPNGDRARLVHDARVLDHAAAEAIAGQLRVFLEEFGRDASPVGALALQDEQARTRMLYEWNDTGVEYARDRCIHELFEERANTCPHDIAVVFEGESLSYRALSERSSRLAHHLTSLGIGPDRLVGLFLDRSIDMVVGVLAVLKAGGAYVPLDPTYPTDRIAYMIEDSRSSVVLTSQKLLGRVPESDAQVVALDQDAAEIATRPSTLPETDVGPENLSYVIYTSGSTGKPKGVMIEHRNVVNFFEGMDERVPHDPPGAWLAVTSLSFDISVLELLWTLTRGFKVVVFADRQRSADAASAAAWRPIDFGLALWGSDVGPGPRKYELMLEAAKFGDRHGFRSVHTPERHFGAFGGPFPNPSVTSAAIAAVTERIEIRASSCVLPLHNPIRVAEEWAVVDNLSGGRVGISFASGWQPNDFVIRPEAFADAKKSMFEVAKIVQRLWRGEAVEFENPHGDLVATATLPRPVQAELPSWMTTAGNVETFRAAGAGGFNVLTHLLGQTLEELAEKIRVYRKARAEAGFDPKAGVVTCMLHTFVGEDLDEVREIVRQPMKDYLSSAMALVVGFAWSFPAFERPGGPDSKPEDVDLSTLTEEETDAILEFAFERYFDTSGLFGTPEVCAQMIERVKAADIDEIASLIDFGVPNDIVLDGLELLDRVRREANEKPAGVEEFQDSPVTTSGDFSFPAQVAEHGITHIQCTPSHANMLLTDPDTRNSLGRIEHWMIGGEAFPVALAAELASAGCRNVTNMYGPTETTIWSSTEVVEGSSSSISIGRPIANTQFYILGNGSEPLPVGVPGELLIGGDGVVRGYLDRPDLTADRFVPDPFSKADGARLYRTGDLASWRSDGTIEFLGRLDHQVKIRGYRIELGEIETRLAELEGIREAVVIPREDTPGDVRLVAYLIADGEPVPDTALRSGLDEHLPEFMLPSAFVFVERYPQTPNGKIDRKALPAPSELKRRGTAEFKPPGSDLERTIAEVWKDVLYLEELGIDDNFFDLGGHSLLVVQAHRKLREACPNPLSLTDLYRFPTIRGLSTHLTSEDAGAEQVEKSQARGEKRRQVLGRRRRRGGQG